MSEIDRRFHETWLGMVQPVEGLVVSVPVLIDAQCMERLPPHVQAKLIELCPPRRSTDAGDEGHTLGSLTRFLTELLGYAPASLDTGASIPDELSLWVPEGRQTVRPTLALRKLAAPPSTESADSTPASRAGARYEMLVWQLPTGLDLDKPETVTGTWDYPPAAKFDRLLRQCRVPIGLLTNDEVLRLVYAPHGESSGAITFRLDDMTSVGGRPILDAFVMLLGANRFFGVEEARALPAILAESRKRQSNVTNKLAQQVFEALRQLLKGFQGAAERDGYDLLDDALAREEGHLYKGLLTVLLRLVFVLYAEDRGLLPVDHPLYARHFSALDLFGQLQKDHDAWPDSMGRRFGAWGRLVALFRAVYLGVDHDDLHMPPRRGDLFDPHRFPFLEGWGPAGSAPITGADARAAVRVPTVDDETVFRVLEKLLLLDGQRLSYRALDVEQIGSVYEALMGYHVVRLTGPSLCLKDAKVWIAADELLAQPPTRRTAWLGETAALAKSATAKLGDALQAASTEAEALAALEPLRVKGSPTGRAGQLVIQPGAERRRTSSHYTPASLTAPIVRRTLEPLLAAMGATPASERLLDLKVCDPAMGSGAFLVEACRFLGDQVVAAWTREGRLDLVASTHGDVVLHARRLVAQRCLYGVDKNPLAVSLARLSLWLVTLAKDEPFTFVDHALRHGDSLVGLDVEQIRSFHWKPGAQMELARDVIDTALHEALDARQGILGLAAKDDTREKERLLWDANDALQDVRLIADLVVGAFFAADKDKAREAERVRRRDLVVNWLESRRAPPEELLAMQAALRERVPAFHWWVEFPEVFYGERADPLDGDRVNRVAWMDAFVGNPPFLGGPMISGTLGEPYRDWLFNVHPGSLGKSDLCAHFLRRPWLLLGDHGTMGFIATNTIAQGDTRESGLKAIVSDGAKIYEAISSMPWPGEAGVSVAIVHICKGIVNLSLVPSRLDGQACKNITSRLTGGTERRDPVGLTSNDGVCFVGTSVQGSGFFLNDLEAGMVPAVERSAVRPYVGGDEIANSPVVAKFRYVIDFGDADEATARTFDWTFRRVEASVRQEREKPSYKGVSWWHHWRRRPELYVTVRGLRRFLATSIVTKHRAFIFVPSDFVISHNACAFAVDRFALFAVVQSRIHIPWSEQLSSSLEDRSGYRPSDCFETFPFPQADPRAVIPALEDVGERLYTARAAYMVDTQQGLTQTYNQLKDPRCQDGRVIALRRLHEEMDRAVLAAYGWDDLVVPPYGTPGTDAERAAVARFEDEVIDRLFALNAQRAAEEKILGLGGATKGKAKGAKQGKKAGNEGQGDLGI